MNEPAGIKELKTLVQGVNPMTGRKFSPASMRRRQRAADTAVEIRDDVVAQFREWAEHLSNLISEIERELDDLEGAADDLENAETGDDREEAYQSVDEALNAVNDAYDALKSELS